MADFDVGDGELQVDDEFPFDSMEKLPRTVSQLPIHRQEKWLHAFQSYLEEFGNEEWAHRAAWAEATKGSPWEKQERIRDRFLENTDERP